jgi:uncharacterized membrane protein
MEWPGAGDERPGAGDERPGIGVLVDEAPVVPTIVESFDGDSPGTADERLPRWVRFFARALLGAQLVAILAFSTVQYSRFALTRDFATYSQAWWAIAHGHLDPFSTTLGVSFWRNNAEFIMWPLSLLDHLYPHPIDLLWVQDAAVVLTELVVFGWISKILEGAKGRIPDRRRTALAVGTAVVLVANPFVYDTIAFDFHLEAIAALFIVLVGYDLWAGRTRRLWWWVSGALLSTALGGIYLVGVGVSGVLAGRETRRQGFQIAGMGAAWVFALTALGAVGVGGQTFSSSYGYLVGPHNPRIAVVDIVLGALGHPGLVLAVVGSHLAVTLSFLVVVGAIGVLSPWGLGMTLVVLVPNILDGSGRFIRVGASFQSWPAMPFILVGSVMVLLRLLENGALGPRLAAVTLSLWAVVLGELAFVALPNVPDDWLSVDASAAQELDHVTPMIPASAEVISTQAVIGRFGPRESIYMFSSPGQTFPVNQRQVVFVVTRKQLLDGDILSARERTAAVADIDHRLDARLLGSRSGVNAWEWSPPNGTTHVTLP